MRRVATAAFMLAAMALGPVVLGPLAPALAQVAPLPPAPPPPPAPTPTPTTTDTTPANPGTGRAVTPLGWYVMGGMFCAAAMPIAGTIILGREMTAAEV